MSMLFGALRCAVLAGVCLAGVSSAALACDCYGDSYGYYRDHDRGYGNYSCYGGGYDCRYEGNYYRAYHHRYDGGYYRPYYHRYYENNRYRDCDDDCR